MGNNFLPPTFSDSSHGNAAFTLLELCIVLIIVGLVTAGIVGGQSLLTNSNLRNIPVRAQEYVVAVDNFRQKYNALPGDMANATQIWGRADGGTPLSSNCASPATDVGATNNAGTCNGDGDQTIGRVVAQNYEVFRIWQHLKLAGFITGNYTGVSGAAGSAQEIAEINVPKGDVETTSYDIAYIDDAALPSAYFSGIKYQHVLHYGSAVSGNNPARGAAISAADANNIDLKMDDGLPGSGKMLTFTNTAQSSCASTDVSATAVYQTANATSNNCTLIFITGF